MKKKIKKKIIFQIVFFLLLVVGTIYVIKQEREKPYFNDRGIIFGTTYSITYQHDNNIKGEIEKEMQKINDALSTFNSQSIISKVNRNENVETNEMFNNVFNLAQQVSQKTNGAFDITVGDLVNLWGFGFKNNETPSEKKIDSLRKFVGYEKVELNNNRIIKKDKRITLDCNAIAKGYASDVVARFLKSKDIKHFMVEIGGEIVVCGLNDKQEKWKIGITKPVDDSLNNNETLQRVMQISDIAVATSGNYRNFYYKDGKKYAHTIDPKSGKPVQHSLLSATVLAPTCAEADAFATAFMVLGVEKAKQILQENPQLAAYFIFQNHKGQYEEWCSERIKKKLK